MAMATGCRTSGSPAKAVTEKPVGHGHGGGGLVGRQPGELVSIRGQGLAWLAQPARHFGFAGMEAEVVEVHMAPAVAALVHDADENLLAGCGLKSTTTGDMVSSFMPEALKNASPVSLRTSSTRVSACCRPPSRNMAKGCVTLNGAEVSVPCGLSSNRS